MTQMHTADVDSALDMLLEEIEAAIETATSAGARAFEARDLVSVASWTERTNGLVAFRDRVAALRAEWEALSPPQQDADGEGGPRRNLGRLSRGRRTPESEYYLPILETLVQMGGQGSVNDVLASVHRRMEGVLRDVDFEPLASSPEQPRWRNAAQWARNALREKGLVRDDSPRGVWAISDKGRAWLDRQSRG